MKTNLKQEDVLAYFRKEFTDFDSIVDEDDGIYSTLGDFAIYLRDGINEQTLSQEYLQKAFNIINTMGASTDLEVQNQLVVGILEIMTDEDSVVELMREELKGNAAKFFERVLIGWNSN